LDTFHWKV